MTFTQEPRFHTQIKSKSANIESFYPNELLHLKKRDHIFANYYNSAAAAFKAGLSDCLLRTIRRAESLSTLKKISHNDRQWISQWSVRCYSVQTEHRCV